MPEFDVLLQDGRKLKVDSPDQQTAIRDAGDWAKSNPRQGNDPLRGAAYQAQRQKSDQGGVLNDIGGAFSSAMSGIPFAQDLAAGIGVPFDARTYQGHPGAAYQDARQAIRADTESYGARHPLASALAQSAGTGGSMLVPGLDALKVGEGANTATQGVKLGRAMQTARGAASGGTAGAVYALGADGTAQDRLNAGTRGAALGAALGAGVGAATGGAPKVPTKRAENVQTLQDAGVFLTPGQKAGGLAKNVEDLAQRAPLLGPAISGARERGVESLNRSVALQALEPIGVDIPASIKTGNETVAYVRDKLGEAYSRAADMVPHVAPDATMAQNLAEIAKRSTDLSESAAAQFERIVKDRIGRLGTGTTGRQAMAVADELESVAAPFASADDGSQQIMGDMLRSVAGEIRGTIARANPDAEKLIQQADQGYSIYVRLRNAASKGKDGISLPGGLRTAVRMEDNSAGKGRVAAGEAKLYDLANASHIMPDQFGNPGTANAAGLGALLVGVPTAPVATAATAAGLGGAATPYMMMGRKVLERLPQDAGQRQLQIAARELARLAQSDPAVRALQMSLAMRMSGAAGVGAGATANAMAAQ